MSSVPFSLMAGMQPNHTCQWLELDVGTQRKRDTESTKTSRFLHGIYICAFTELLMCVKMVLISGEIYILVSVKSYPHMAYVVMYGQTNAICLSLGSCRKAFMHDWAGYTLCILLFYYTSWSPRGHKSILLQMPLWIFSSVVSLYWSATNYSWTHDVCNTNIIHFLKSK